MEASTKKSSSASRRRRDGAPAGAVFSPGWYLQQLLKLYAQRIIPGLLDRVLVCDADTVFLRGVDMLARFHDGGGGGASSRLVPLYTASAEHNRPFLEHMSRLLPSLPRVHGMVSGVSHHMILERDVVEALFAEVEAAPALWPKTMMLSGSPPNDAMFR